MIKGIIILVAYDDTIRLSMLYGQNIGLHYKIGLHTAAIIKKYNQERNSVSQKEPSILFRVFICHDIVAKIGSFISKEDCLPMALVILVLVLITYTHHNTNITALGAIMYTAVVCKSEMLANKYGTCKSLYLII